MTIEDDFHDACFGDRIDEALALIDRGLSLTWRDPLSGWSFLHLAVEQRQARVMRRLVEVGAEVDAIDHAGWTPLCLAVDSDIDTAGQSDEDCDLSMTRLLLELGATPGAGRGTSAIEIAEDYGNADAVALLGASDGDP